MVEECLLEVAQEICNSTSHPNTSENRSKVIKPNLETSLKELENGECINTQNNNFESIAKGIMPAELNTFIQTYNEINSGNNETVIEKMSQIQQHKIQEECHNILQRESQVLYNTQATLENHKVSCIRKDDASKCINISDSTENEKYNHRICNRTLEGKNAQTCDANRKLNNISKVREPILPIYCLICSQVFKCQQDCDNHKRLHKNLTENISMSSSKQCGHCKEVYDNKKDLLNHITHSHKGQLLFRCSVCERTYEKWSSLDIHEATHRADKPFLCDLCGKSFKHSNNLRGHKRIHLDESIKKRHVCEICGNAFRSR